MPTLPAPAPLDAVAVTRTPAVPATKAGKTRKVATKTVAKTATQPAPKAAVARKPTAKTAPVAAKKRAPAKASKVVKAAKPPLRVTVAPVAAKSPAKAKPKLVRDSFTMPKAEYAVIDELKQRAAKLGRAAKKSELLRAGVKALNAMSDDALQAALRGVPTIKTGRPHRTA